MNVEMRLGFKWLETARLQNVRDDVLDCKSLQMAHCKG